MLALIGEERKRIASELHDDSVQAMTAVSLRLQRLKGRLDDPADQQAVEDLRRDVDAAIDRLRHMLFSLDSPTLGEDGLVVTLEIYLETYVEPTGLSWEVHGNEQMRFSPDLQALAFRLARSAIINVVKHAKASQIRIGVVEVDDGGLEVTIHDDGVGFDLERASHPLPGHAGLSYARSLAASVGGRYTVNSRPGYGTAVTFRLPEL